MKHYVLPASLSAQKLPFYLAMEEWIALRHDGEDAFFVWQVAPTVIFGRNQCIDTEVDIEYCRRNNIQMYRRKSGGGCVYADDSNLMFSYITDDRGEIAEIFARYTQMVARAMHKLGIDAEASGRNDITIDGRKVSGNAFYRTPEGTSIVHGTMLYDTDMTHMSNAITPSRSKLESNQVKSVESRITFLRKHTTLTIDQFRALIVKDLCDSEYNLTDSDIEEIHRIEQTYYSVDWIMGRRHGAEHPHRKRIRIAGVGEIEAEVTVDADGKITGVSITGDFFGNSAELESSLSSRLKGTPFRRENISAALKDYNVSEAVEGFENNQLINILI